MERAFVIPSTLVLPVSENEAYADGNDHKLGWSGVRVGDSPNRWAATSSTHLTTELSAGNTILVELAGVLSSRPVFHRYADDNHIPRPH
ncbi:hypothetical protein PGT21_030765 [Puccinia graminis f. sp. tritici]|uniref:Uncharacterized protein n=1 Tax=Puccinia graminis f. sp. tritici TaxID=56615 RepID=A0A5B0MRU2_PUCGR|nr:hypothetical protein PGTUg99_016664 [Puccinia graminis f. sp. tritici]KAA1094812.1 hypothetical protein PGT21_030765 [Puccinia graminis f. sp. tritici]